MFNSLEDALKSAAVSTREKLALIESISEMNLEISITGRVHDGELKIEFKLSGGWQNDSRAKGGSLDAVVKEFLRRNGWDMTNAPLCLSFAPEVVEDDGAQNEPQTANSEDIPF